MRTPPSGRTGRSVFLNLFPAACALYGLLADVFVSITKLSEMKKSFALIVLTCSVLGVLAQPVRQQWQLQKNWKFTKGDVPAANDVTFDDAKWQAVTVPHDWAIYGPFDENNDLQIVAVTQNNEKVATKKTGRTGGLPYMGVGWYRTQFSVPDYQKGQRRVSLLFDGAMSEARVYVNGHEAIFWPNGYNSFHVDVTDYLTENGLNNILAVRLENKEQSSRWYPGAGLYRNVHVVVTANEHVPVWGTYLTTPFVSEQYASVRLQTKMVNVAVGTEVKMVTTVIDDKGKVATVKETTQKVFRDLPYEQNFIMDNPRLWTPETPNMYRAVSDIYINGNHVDSYTTRFGVRDIRVVADKGFFLNGQLRKFQGVCNHHDLGPLGAAINTAALRRQLVMLKDMGVDAIRTAHNMPAPELVQLCDEMGFMMMIEPFDEWDRAKCKNGYHRFFKEWAEKDMVNMLHQYRNNASVVMWSIGNEVPTQCSGDGYRVAKFLQDICHREDPTRPVTCGMDQVTCVLNNGFAALVDVAGLNYRVHRYQETYDKLPQSLVLGTETASTVSSRGVYKFPVVKKADAKYSDNQSSSYDFEYCNWSNLPDDDFALADDKHWTMGQFVWTGFDYLGEPSPYDTDAWPSHSSLFGIIDLASLPKDRYYLYRSLWNKTSETLHVLPHWTWPGREGQVTPVFVYTNYPSAELFVNGKSQGRQTKNNTSVQHRYRLMWMDVVYEPGEVKVVAYDEKGNAVSEKIVRTAGKPHRIELDVDRSQLIANGDDLAYITVKVVDKAGNLCPHESRMVNFSVTGQGMYRAAANGDATSLDLFHLPKMPLFSGMLTAIVQSSEKGGQSCFQSNSTRVKSSTSCVEG
jgi:beta-galactosidase